MARKGSRKRLNKRGGTTPEATPEATADVQAATSGVNVADIKGMFSNLGTNLGNKVSSSLGDVNSQLEGLHAKGENLIEKQTGMVKEFITSNRDAAAGFIKGEQPAPAPGPTGGRRRRSTKRKTARRSRSKRSRSKRSRKNKRKTNKRSRSKRH